MNRPLEPIYTQRQQHLCDIALEYGHEVIPQQQQN